MRNPQTHCLLGPDILTAQLHIKHDRWAYFQSRYASQPSLTWETEPAVYKAKQIVLRNVHYYTSHSQ